MSRPEPAAPTGRTGSFVDTGLVGPVRVFDAAEANALGDVLLRAPAPDSWGKGAAATSPDWFEVATRPVIVDRVAALLGDDVLLCGANLVERDPGQLHSWHVDTHLADPAGRAVTVWIGLRNVSVGSSLRVVPGSHRFGFCPEQRAAEAGIDLMAVSDDDVERWARASDPDAALESLQMGVGDAVFIDGSLWHATLNTTNDTRLAMLLQYCTPDKPVRLHAPVTGWPFEPIDQPRPPCQIVRGSAAGNVNRLVPAPRSAASSQSAVFHTAGVFEQSSPDWKPDPLFVGSTTSLAYLLLKTYVAFPGVTDHGGHAHAEEQITLVVDQPCDVRIGTGPTPMVVPVAQHGVAYLPPGTVHSSHNGGVRPSHIIDISWLGAGGGVGLPLGVGVFDLAAVEPDADSLAERGRSAVEVASGPTATLDRFRLLCVDMAPGFVGADDVDAYDVVLVVMAGQISTLGSVAGAGDAVMFAAGEVHSISVVGNDPVRLIVFEFHSTYTGRPMSSLRRNLVARLPRSVRIGVRRARRALKERSRV